MNSLALQQRTAPPSAATRQIQDIIYVSIMSTMMLAALLERILWLLAFLYCPVKVYSKADGKGRIGVRILVVANTMHLLPCDGRHASAAASACEEISGRLH
jgi:hypothetical protein